VAVASSAPLGLFNVHLGPGCSFGTPPTLHAIGTPPRATLGNATFALRSTGNQALQPHYLFYARAPGSYRIGRCTTYLGMSLADLVYRDTVVSDVNGVAVHPVPVPNRIALEGLDVYFQASGLHPGAGRLYSDYDLSEGLRVRFGNALQGCP
jgi:hypothetical protein